MRTSPNRLLATVFGGVYLLVGLLGFAVTGGVSFIATEGGLLLGIVGFFLVGTALNILALNTADHFLHLASAIVLLGVGLAADKSVRTRATTVNA